MIYFSVSLYEIKIQEIFAWNGIFYIIQCIEEDIGGYKKFIAISIISNFIALLRNNEPWNTIAKHFLNFYRRYEPVTDNI